jgi:hypothetical protein
VRSRIKLLISLIGVITTVTTAYVAYLRTHVNDQIHEANVAIATAMDAAAPALAKAREVDALLNEIAFKSERAKLTSAARETSRLYSVAAKSLRSAVGKVTAAIQASDSDVVRSYYVTRLESLEKRVETAEAAQEGYAVAADESITDLATLRDRMEPLAVRAETARAEAKRLAAEAEAFREQNRGEF